MLNNTPTVGPSPQKPERRIANRKGNEMTMNTLPALAVVLTGFLATDGIQASPADDRGKQKPETPATLTAEAREAMELGRKVIAVRQAIANPQTPGAMEAVTALGHDSRYYVMVRGWLTQQLAGDQSILDASGENTPKAVKDRIAFLHKAIRAIDLE